MAEMYVIVSANIEDELMKRGIFSWVDYYAKNDRLFVQTEQATTIVSKELPFNFYLKRRQNYGRET